MIKLAYTTVAAAYRRSADFSPQKSPDGGRDSFLGLTQNAFEYCCGLKSALRPIALLWWLGFGIWSFSSQIAHGQDKPNLPASRYLHGEQTLQAFAPISKATRDSIVKFNVDGETVVL